MLLDLFKDYSPASKYLILGKGQTLDRFDSTQARGYTTISLNEVCRDRRVDIAHVIDLDVVDRLGTRLLDNASVTFMPYIPHLGHKPSTSLRLSVLAEKHLILSQLAQANRLYGYNLSTSMERVTDSPVVKARGFSAEAVVDILAKLGVTHIRTLGVDGGHSQSPTFSDLKNCNLDRGYDQQWQNIRRAIRKHSLDYAPFGLESPIRIFIGAGERQLIPALVLRHSILKHVTMSCEVTPMHTWKHPMPKLKKNWPRTPFSFQRFMIPEACGYKGHAIYMDSDMLVFGDIKEVWQGGMGTHSVLAMRGDDIDKHRAQFSHILLNCEKLEWDIRHIVSQLDSGELSYDDLVFNCTISNSVQSGFNPHWNSLEEYVEGQTKLLHYTEMHNQPWWANLSNPNAHLWFQELKEAVADNSISRSLVEEHVARKWLLSKCLEVL